MNKKGQTNLADSLCAELASAWKTGSRIKIEDLLDRSADRFELANGRSRLEQTLIVSLLQYEIELRRKHGETPSAEEYAVRFPQLSRDVLEDLMTCPMLPAFDEQPQLFPNRYRQIEMVGQGGLGQVWRVVDTHMGRSLAIKIARQRSQNRHLASIRLEREAKLTGALQHPGIPPVFDHGKLTDGSEYFSMKLVEGKTLDSILQDRQSNLQEIPALINIFEQIAQTVAYAHSQQVIHRDLKPQNVMVGKFGEVQVMDWGMAKRLTEESARIENAKPGNTVTPRSAMETVMSSNDSSDDQIQFADPLLSLTQTGEVFGTPAYMAPEQARGEITSLGPQSDVFGLGAILFTILTGSHLYGELAADEVLLKAAKGDLGGSLKRLDQVASDRELIQLCRDCLRPQLEDRPVNAEMVAHRVTDYQESVQRRLQQSELDQQAAEVRACEERKRRRATSWLSAAILAAVTVGLLGVSWQWNNASKASALAQERLGQTRTVVDKFLSQVAQDGGLMAKTPGTQELRRKLLEMARDYYVNVIAESKEDQETRFETAAAYSRLAKISDELDPGSDTGFAMREETIRLLEQLIHENSGDPIYEHWEYLVDARYDIAFSYSARSEYAKAITAYEKSEETIHQWIKHFGTDHVKFQLAKNTHNMGLQYRELGNHEQALEYFLMAILQAEPLLEANEKDTDFILNVAVMNISLGVQYGWYQKSSQDWSLARDYTQTALAMHEKLVELEPDKTVHKENVIITLNNLGMIHYNLKVKGEPKATRIERCRDAFDRAEEMGKKIVNGNPGIPRYIDALANQLANYSTFLAYQGDDQGSGEKARQAGEYYYRIATTHPQVVNYSVQAIQNLETYAGFEGICPESDRAVAKALVVYRQLIAQTPESQRNRTQFAIRLAASTQEESNELLEMTNALAELDSPTDDQVCARALALYRNARFEEALALLDRIQPQTRVGFHALVSCLVNTKLGNVDAADEAYQTAKSYLDNVKKPDTYYELQLQIEYLELQK